MARLLGIDATKTTVRAALLHTSYRSVTIEAFGEADVASCGSEVEAIRAAVGSLRADATAIGISGERSFYRRLDLPAAAQKELGSVLAFELESTVPFEMDEAVFDFRVMKRGPNDAPDIVPVFAVLARTDDVRGRITPVREAIGVEPERVASGPLPLANLTQVMLELERPAVPGPLAVLDLGESCSEVLILLAGEPVFARTLARHRRPARVGAGPRARAAADVLGLAIARRRSAHGHVPHGHRRQRGGGRALPLDRARRLHPPVPQPRIEGMTPEQTERLPRFAKAVSLALGLTGRTRGMNLRRGALEAERSYPSCARRSRSSPASARSSS